MELREGTCQTQPDAAPRRGVEVNEDIFDGHDGATPSAGGAHCGFGPRDGPQPLAQPRVGAQELCFLALEGGVQNGHAATIRRRTGLNGGDGADDAPQLDIVVCDQYAHGLTRMACLPKWR
jgi:hypothetical protein